jgi:hypothetical protein
MFEVPLETVAVFIKLYFVLRVFGGMSLNFIKVSDAPPKKNSPIFFD